MTMPKHGALGATFTVVRGMQGIALISIIGMTANFIAEMVSTNNTPPSVLIGTLSVVSFLHKSNHYRRLTQADYHRRFILSDLIYPIL
jgi:hypothetical protein